jgi:adenylate kinase family enzyme
MKATVKQIFNYIGGLNPSVSTVSSIGNFVSSQNEQLADATLRECIENVPKDSLAYKILTSTVNRFSEKQLWVIAFELEKNEEFANMVGGFYKEINARENFKIERKAAKLSTNKEASQPVLDFIKSNGKKLADYYDFLKKNKSYKREFYSKNFSMDSANEFLSNN